MQYQEQQQGQADEPQQSAERLQRLGVSVHLFLTQIHLEIAGHVSEQERHENNTRPRHNELAQNGRFEKS